MLTVILSRNASHQAIIDLKAEIVNQHIPPEITKGLSNKLGVEILPKEDTESSQKMANATSTQRLPRSRTVDITNHSAGNTGLAAGSISTSTVIMRTPLAVLSAKSDENRNLPLFSTPSTSPSLTLAPTLSESVLLYIKQIPGTVMEDLKPIYVASARDLEQLMEGMVRWFDGKETEANWAERQKSIVTLRELVRGNAVSDYMVEFITCLRFLADGIIKAVSSLRTTLSTHGCKLVSDLANITGSAIDSFADSFTQTLIKLSASTKKIAGQSANASLVVLLAYTSFQHRIAVHVCGACRDKNASARLFGAGWLQVLLMVHVDQKLSMEATNCIEIFESSIKSCLADANPHVRESMRATYWEFQALWPNRASALINNLDPMARKALEKANPNSSKNSSLSSGAAEKPVAAAARPRVSAVAKAIMEAKQKQEAQAQIQKPALRGLDKPAVNMTKSV